VKRWEFDRIVVAHGEIIVERPREIFAELCSPFVEV
jgi:hypothetical protein